jgi:uncharacterized membrane protein
MVDSRCNWGDEHICLAVAAGHCTDAAFDGLYVQGNEFDICVVVLYIVVWRGHHLEQCHWGDNYHNRNHTILQGMIYYLLVVFSVLAAAGAQMLLKQGAKKQYASFWQQYLNPWVIGGYGIMGASLLLNIFCLSHGVKVNEISVIESLSYLFVPVLSCFFFMEKITWRKAGAIALIMLGIVVFFI